MIINPFNIELVIRSKLAFGFLIKEGRLHLCLIFNPAFPLEDRLQVIR